MIALLLTFVWGGAMAVFEALGWSAASLYPVEHAHLAFVGWLVNSVIGFALWLLPLHRQRYPQTQGRYATWMPWATYALLNGGLLLRIVSEPLASQSAIARAALASSAVLQAAAIVVFICNAWTRTRAASRPAPGVR